MSTTARDPSIDAGVDNKKSAHASEQFVRFMSLASTGMFQERLAAKPDKAHRKQIEPRSQITYSAGFAIIVYRNRRSVRDCCTL